MTRDEKFMAVCLWLVFGFVLYTTITSWSLGLFRNVLGVIFTIVIFIGALTYSLPLNRNKF